MGLWGSVPCNGVTQCWPAQRGQAIVPGSSPYMVHEKWIQAHAQQLNVYIHHKMFTVLPPRLNEPSISAALQLK